MPSFTDGTITEALSMDQLTDIFSFYDESGWFRCCNYSKIIREGEKRVLIERSVIQIDPKFKKTTQCKFRLSKTYDGLIIDANSSNVLGSSNILISSPKTDQLGYFYILFMYF